MRLATRERTEYEKAERRRLVEDLTHYLHDPLNPDRFVPSLEESAQVAMPKETPETVSPEDAERQAWLIEREIGHPASELPTETRQRAVEVHERMRQAPRNLKRMPRNRKTAG